MSTNKDYLLGNLEQMEEEDYEPPPPPFNPLDKTPQELMRIMLFEFIGTALFAYGIISSRGSDAAVAVALFGGIFISAKFSGGHVNPAVSFSFYCSNAMTMFTLRMYWISQISGVFLGAIVARMILNETASPHIEDDRFEWVLSDFFGETLGTFIFVLFIHIQVHEKTQFTENGVLGIAMIATALYFSRMFTYHSGGCLNPAIGLGLEVFKSFEVGMQRLANVWVFLFAPLLGAQLASEFYRNVYLYYYPEK